MIKYYYSNELYHYGIPGMRWGHRKQYYSSSANSVSGRNKFGDRAHGFMSDISERYNKRKEYKRAKKIVEGGKLRKKGQTILGRNLQSRALSFLAYTQILGTGISAAKKHADQNAILFTKNYGAIPVANIDYALSKALATGTAIGIGVNNHIKTSQMRAYDNATAKERKEAEEIVKNYRKR